MAKSYLAAVNLAVWILGLFSLGIAGMRARTD